MDSASVTSANTRGTCHGKCHGQELPHRDSKNRWPVWNTPNSGVPPPLAAASRVRRSPNDDSLNPPWRAAEPTREESTEVSVCVRFPGSRSSGRRPSPMPDYSARPPAKRNMDVGSGRVSSALA